MKKTKKFIIALLLILAIPVFVACSNKEEIKDEPPTGPLPVLPEEKPDTEDPNSKPDTEDPNSKPDTDTSPDDGSSDDKTDDKEGDSGWLPWV